MLRTVSAVAVGTLALVSASQASAQNTNNRITQVKAISQNLLEVEITSDQEFPVLDSVITFHIGNKSSTISRSPENGSLNTVIFTVTASDLNAGVKNGDDAWVDYSGQVRGLRWELGKLDAAKVSNK